MSKTSESKAGKKEKKADKPKRVTGQNGAPRGFLVEHGEKAAFGIFGLIVILCVLGALRHEPYTKTPEQLAASLQQKRQAVKQNTPDTFEPLKTVQPVPYGDRVGESVAPVPDEYRVASTGWLVPDLKIMRKRGEPAYLGIENLKAHPINEALAMLAAGAKKAVPAKEAPAKAPAKAAPGKKKDLLAPPVPAVGKKKPGAAKEPSVGMAKVEPPNPNAGAAAPTRGGVHAPNADAKAFPGMLIVGTIPRKKQADLFEREFVVARDYDQVRDTPHYVSFLIQRSKDGGKTWEDQVTVQTAKGPKELSLPEAYLEISQKFAMEFPEIVDSQYIVTLSAAEKKAEDAPGHGGFVSTLPPILGRDWDEMVAGGFPVIHKAAGQEGFSGPGGGMGAGGGLAPPGGAAPASGGPTGGLPQPGRPAGGQAGEKPGPVPQPGGAIRKQLRGPEGSPMPPGVKQPAGFAGPQPGQPGSKALGAGNGAGGIGSGVPGAGLPGSLTGGPPGMGVRPGGNPFGAKTQQPARPVMDIGNNRSQDPTCDLLFRFFDLTAEEGQTYQYRVALVLENPNLDLAEGLLKDVRLRKDKYRYSPPSEPTEPVRISVAGSEIVAGPVRGARVEAGSVESATVILRQRHPQNGALVAHTFNRLEAGQVLNFKAQAVKYEKAVGGVETTPLAEFDFKSDELLLDLKGGGDRGSPGEILLLDANGRLIVKGEATHAEASTKGADGQPMRDPRSTAAGSSVHFASENKRLEYIYNYAPPTTAGAAGSRPSFDDLLKPMK